MQFTLTTSLESYAAATFDITFDVLAIDPCPLQAYSMAFNEALPSPVDHIFFLDEDKTYSLAVTKTPNCPANIEFVVSPNDRFLSIDHES